ncbi:MAG: MarR family transcriptional regulator [Anaerolineae bacterium]|nr:MarR family transcriptional regulator [Anaerolineae bacterium]
MFELTPIMEKFILQWGEMGSTWGINRATAQMAALLYLSPTPLTAEDLSETLAIARSTVSTGLRELQNWGLVKIVHILGDRRDHFEMISDAGELFRVIVRQRKAREVDPLLYMLRRSVDAAGEDNAQVRERLQEMLDFLEMVATLYDRTEQIPTKTLVRIGQQMEQMPVETLSRLVQLGDGFGESLSKIVKR